MKKIILVVALALGLSGCSTLGFIRDVVTSPPKEVVTKEMLYTVENSATLVVAGLVAYKRSCAAKLIEQTCVAKVQRIQAYTTRLPPYLKALRRFVRLGNSQSAMEAFREVERLIAGAKQEGV